MYNTKHIKNKWKHLYMLNGQMNNLNQKTLKVN